MFFVRRPYVYRYHPVTEEHRPPDPCLRRHSLCSPSRKRTGPGGRGAGHHRAGDYVFSEKPRSLPGADALCRYEVGPDSTCTLVQAFGRDLTGRHGRYDLDFGEEPAAPEELHPVCGNFVEEIILPDSLQVIGSCAFYNCRRLRRLSVGAGDLTVGSDVFLNCFALADLLVRAAPEEKTGLFALVNNIHRGRAGTVLAPRVTARPRAGLWYPAYWEDVEESPAHILLHTFSGQGYHYRQCFLDGKILSAEYDAIFPDGHAAEDQGVAAMLCFDRLRWPWNLTEKAKAPYREFLAAHTGLVLQRLLKAQDTDSIKDLLALDVLDAAAFAEGAALAAKADNAAAAALLADAEHKKKGSAPKKRRYDFDF